MSLFVPAAEDTEQAPAAAMSASLLQRVRQGAGSWIYAVGDQAVYSLGNLAVAALLSRHDGPRAFGIYILTQRSMDVLIQLSNVFLWAPFSFNLPGTAAAARASYRGSVFAWQILACALFTAAIFVAARWASTPSRGLYYGTFAPLVPCAAAILFREYTRRMYFAELRIVEAFWTDLATVLLQVGGVGALLLAGRLSVPSALAALGGGAALVSLWWLLRDLRGLRFGWGTMLADGRRNLHLGRWFLGGNLVYMVSAQCNPWVLGAALGGSAVGGYAVCEQVVNIPRVALNSIQNLMAPVLARRFQEGGRIALRREVRRMDLGLTGFSFGFAGILCVLGPWFGRVVFHAQPMHARRVIVLLALNLVAYAASLAQSYGLTAMDRADTTLYANLAGLAVQATLCWPLVHRFGLAGAAAAMLLGSLVMWITRHSFYRREVKRA